MAKHGKGNADKLAEDLTEVMNRPEMPEGVKGDLQRLVERVRGLPDGPETEEDRDSPPAKAPEDIPTPM